MKKSKLPRDLFIVSLLTLITVFTWIVFDVYRAAKKIEIPEVLQRQIEPINPEINTSILEDLSKRDNMGKSDVPPLATPTPTKGP